jgi:hypothetical protein
MKLTHLIKQLLEEQKKKADRCKRIADRKYDKPSAYKSGSIVRCRQGKIWKDLKEEDTQEENLDPKTFKDTGRAGKYGSGYSEYKKLNEYSDKIITQLISKFKTEKPDLDDDIIIAYIKRFSEIKDSPNVSQKDITKYTWDDLEKVISDNQSKRIKAGKINNGEPSKDTNLVYNQNNLRIYAGKTKEACIKYGNGYSFCISSRGKGNAYDSYRFDENGTPYFIFDDTKSSKQNKDGSFIDPKHLLVLFTYTPEEDFKYGNEVYTITNADNNGENVYNNFNEIEKYHPRLKGLKNIFQPIEDYDPKDKAEYDLKEEYNDKINELGLNYYEKEKLTFRFEDIKTADEYIDDLINNKIQLYRVDALLKPETAKVNDNKYFFTTISQNRFIKSSKNIDTARQDFIENILLPSAYDDDVTLEDILNDWNIYFVKLDNPAYKQYFQDIKKLVDEYRSEIAKVKLLKENLSKIIKEIIQEDESLHKWFKRKGTPGKEGGWVDCNTCRKGKCKPCGRKEGEKRAKYPSCRPTPAQCKTKGKGKKWGKTK